MIIDNLFIDGRSCEKFKLLNKCNYKNSSKKNDIPERDGELMPAIGASAESGTVFLGGGASPGGDW